MKLKRKIDKATFDALSDEHKKFYAENSSRRGEYLLDFEDDDENPLKTAYERTKQEKEGLASQLTELQAKIAELEKKPESKKTDKDIADLKALETSYEKKIADLTADLTGKLKAKDDYIKTVLADTKAAEIAARISKTPKLLQRALRDRLEVDFSGDVPALKVLDDTGKPSAFSLDDLEKEFVANPDYAAIIIGSKATGGDADKRPGGAGDARFTDKTPLLSAMPVADLKAHMASKIKA
jgi:predicted RNase H-like nuclease (RuvC/YqgF family)